MRGHLSRNAAGICTARVLFFDGEFRNDMKNGPGIIYHADGTVELAVFESDEFAEGVNVTFLPGRQSAYEWLGQEDKNVVGLEHAYAIARRMGLQRWVRYKHPWLL